jgi:hypothetical protein
MNMKKSKLFIDEEGTKEWKLDGKFHRLNGPARVWVNGSKHWYVDGNLNRLNGPAIEDADGTKKWYVDGKLHRLDGPAIEDADGTKKWYIHNIQYKTKQEHALAAFSWIDAKENDGNNDVECSFKNNLTILGKLKSLSLRGSTLMSIEFYPFNVNINKLLHLGMLQSITINGNNIQLYKSDKDQNVSITDENDGDFCLKIVIAG